MTTLILIRHGEAGSGRTDLERPLTAHGITQSQAVGEWLRDADLVPDRALVSPARRTVETFRALGLPTPMTVIDELYDCDGQRILDEVNALPGDIEVLLVVAHFPGAPEATALLDPASELAVFAPATTVVIELDDGPAAGGTGRIRQRYVP
jgi:phosphohistidine phosphatase